VSLVGRALTQAVKARAAEVGFDRVAIGPCAPPAHARAFEQWLDAGFAGSMGYLDRTRAARTNPKQLLPGCQSVIAVALAYDTQRAGDDWKPVARYARGRDYHDVMSTKLAHLVDVLREAGGPGIESRAAVDTSAVLERDLAARVGLGWVGKNTNLIAETLGSYFFIGIVLTTAELEPDESAPDRCGTCTACLDACPTQAFVAPHVLDARRCIAYLTIEHRGDVDDDLRPAIADWVFGCDVCQEVCPWNRKAPPAREAAFAPPGDFGPMEALLELDEARFRERFRGTAIMRAKRAGLLRNAALVLGNRRDDRAVPALRGALGDPAPIVRRAVSWALARIAAGSSTDAT
jgi:epoxyqueuosine reductase